MLSSSSWLTPPFWLCLLPFLAWRMPCFPTGQTSIRASAIWERNLVHEKLQFPKMSMLEHSKHVWPSPVRENCTTACTVQSICITEENSQVTSNQPHVCSNNWTPVKDDSLTLSGISCSVVLQVGCGSYTCLFSWSQFRDRMGKTWSKQELSCSMRLENLFTSLLILPISTVL